MNKIQTTETADQESEQLNKLIINAIQNVKGKNISLLDLRNLDEAPTHFFIICEGESSTQVNAISRSIHKDVKETLGVNPEHKEGLGGSQWVLVDYFNTVIHIFHPEAREFYALDDLWSDAIISEYKNL